MVQKDLVDYVRLNHSRGHAYHDLYVHMIKHGHSHQDSADAIEAVQKEHHQHAFGSKKEKKIRKAQRKVFWGSMIVVSVMLIFILIFTIPDFSLKKDCGEDIACFSAAASECRPATAVYKANAALFGMEISSETFIQIKGEKNGKCVYYDRVASASVKLGSSLRQQLLDSGVSEADIALQEAEASKMAVVTVGFAKQCMFEKQKLAEIISKLQAGTFSGGFSCALGMGGTSDCRLTGDFSAEDCVILTPQMI